MNDQQVKKVNRKDKKVIRPLSTTLIAIVISANLFVVVDTIATNRTTKQVNNQISKLNKKQAKIILRSEELQILIEEVNEQRLENNEKLNEIIIRANLRLDQLNQP